MEISPIFWQWTLVCMAKGVSWTCYGSLNCLLPILASFFFVYQTINLWLVLWHPYISPSSSNFDQLVNQINAWRLLTILIFKWWSLEFWAAFRDPNKIVNHHTDYYVGNTEDSLITNIFYFVGAMFMLILVSIIFGDSLSKVIQEYVVHHLLFGWHYMYSHYYSLILFPMNLSNWDD